ncbi:hypothetical protein [Marinobacterium sp. MBR-109]|jgi:ketopantoate reductase|uniref:hypothetical protein n=1 Tax=Marinobacterium sp. MBR-109 TaxID=3156462 RepID=UPI00339A16C3
MRNQPQNPKAAKAPPAMSGQQPAEEMAQDESASPQYESAIKTVYKLLYEKGAGKDAIEAISSAANKTDAMANMAYELAQVAAENEESFPEDDLTLLATSVLAEIGDIAEAAGIEIAASDVAEAFKIMLLRMLGELGLDTTKLEQAMSAYTPEMIDEAVGYAYGGQEAQNV